MVWRLQCGPCPQTFICRIISCSAYIGCSTIPHGCNFSQLFCHFSNRMLEEYLSHKCCWYCLWHDCDYWARVFDASEKDQTFGIFKCAFVGNHQNWQLVQLDYLPTWAHLPVITIINIICELYLFNIILLYNCCFLHFCQIFFCQSFIKWLRMLIFNDQCIFDIM